MEDNFRLIVNVDDLSKKEVNAIKRANTNNLKKRGKKPRYKTTMMEQICPNCKGELSTGSVSFGPKESWWSYFCRSCKYRVKYILPANGPIKKEESNGPKQ